MVDQFALGMRLIHKHDAQVREDGFDLVKQVATANVADLIAAYIHEEEHGLRCWLLELIGEARSSEALPILSAALTSYDESIRDWARFGLQELNCKESRTLLWREQNQASS